MSQGSTAAPTWKRVVAAVLDFIMVFFAGGYAIAAATGGLTGDGFKLEGAPALLLFALIIAYFVLGYRVVGGTLWQRILGVV